MSREEETSTVDSRSLVDIAMIAVTLFDLLSRQKDVQFFVVFVEDIEIELAISQKERQKYPRWDDDTPVLTKR
jgi:hypothetical protein